MNEWSVYVYSRNSTNGRLSTWATREQSIHSKHSTILLSKVTNLDPYHGSLVSVAEVSVLSICFEHLFKEKKYYTLEETGVMLRAFYCHVYYRSLRFISYYVTLLPPHNSHLSTMATVHSPQGGRCWEVRL